MKFLTTVAAAALVLASANAAFAARAYIGTYTKDPAATRGGGNGEGIYLADIDDATGAPSHLRLMVKTLSPSWITLSADHKFLYAVNEVASYGAGKSNAVSHQLPPYSRPYSRTDLIRAKRSPDGGRRGASPVLERGPVTREGKSRHNSWLNTVTVRVNTEALEPQPAPGLFLVVVGSG